MIEVIRNGGQNCIVDAGRYNYRRYGVPISGAMDLHSAASANSLLHNNMKVALLELTMPGHVLRFHTDTFVALAGAEGDFEINEEKIYNDHIYEVKDGSVLIIGKLTRGCRVYLAVPGGIESTTILGSQSPLPGFLERTLVRGNKVAIVKDCKRQKTTSIVAPLNIALNQEIRCYPGPEWHLLSGKEQEIILASKFVIDNKSNRMGYRLIGQNQFSQGLSIYSSSVMPGTVQLLPNGQPLILMRDCQTTGGYPRILQVFEEDINQLAQRKPGNDVKFHIYS